MGGGIRLLHNSYFTRYFFGTIAFWQIANFTAEQWIGINRTKDPDLKWKWWADIMDQKRAGLIPMNYPGFMLAQYRNEQEEFYKEKYNYEPLPNLVAEEEEE